MFSKLNYCLGSFCSMALAKLILNLEKVACYKMDIKGKIRLIHDL